MITAVVLIHVEIGKANQVGDALADLPGVAEVYSVAGDYDLVAIIRVQVYEHLADLVVEKISKVPGIRSTKTLMAFRMYSRHDLERMWSVGLEERKANTLGSTTRKAPDGK